MVRVLTFLLSSLLVGAILLNVLYAQPAQQDTGRYAIGFGSTIAEYLKQDSITPPPKKAILFIGSSIFRQWANLQQQMAPLLVFNRAFGGSRTHEVYFYMDKIVLPYEPKMIVYYCGSNDINAGEPPMDILRHFKLFSQKVMQRLPGTHIFYVSINKAPQKKSRWGTVDSANAMIRQYCLATTHHTFIDVNPMLFDKNGNPRLELYESDLLHFKAPAYEELTKVIKPVLQEAWAKRK